MKLSNEDAAKIKLHILRKLAIHDIWGARHTSFDELQKCLPAHMRGTANDIAVELIKRDFLLSRPTAYGLQVSLNPKHAEEIKHALGIT